MVSLARKAGFFCAYALTALAAAWAVGALYFDLPWPSLRVAAAVILGLAFASALVFVPGRLRRLGVILASFAVVLLWWLSLKPSNEAEWQPDVAQLAWSETNGDDVTLHNVRNVDYRTETEYTPHWETRKVRLSHITGIDMAINYWGSPYMAHPIVSFQFSDSPPICFSIETRKKVGESYSAIGGLYRQYELIYIVADERDVIRVRTNYRKGEDIYLYRLNISPEEARGRFVEYLASLNQLHAKPRWYNAATTNCTTSIRSQHAAAKRRPWDWRILVNGKGDEMLYQNGTLRRGGLPFDELKKRSLIDAAAKAANDAPDFSARIRENAPSFK